MEPAGRRNDLERPGENRWFAHHANERRVGDWMWLGPQPIRGRGLTPHRARSFIAFRMRVLRARFFATTGAGGGKGGSGA